MNGARSLSAVVYLIVFAPLLVAFPLTGLMRRISLAGGLLDVPNERSSHATPTPRGGGVAIVISSLGAWCVLWGLHALDFDLFMALSVGGLAVAIVGLIDDRRPLRTSVRLVVHIAAAVWAVSWLGKLPLAGIAGMPFVTARAVQVVAVLGIVWMLNLFNFMDGIDGIAASEAIFWAWGGAWLQLLTGGYYGTATTALALGSACLGFLMWNWPPAKIFMGDVGSGYLGYVIAVMALAATRTTPSALWVWLILGGVFFVDATVTLIRRTVRGERVFEAHRRHAYQWLARKWGSHRRVTISVTLLNLLWLLPLALVAGRFPQSAAWIAVVALVPLAALAIFMGAGRREVS
jgi:Fuc2NAc and GlcNAc transferase